MIMRSLAKDALIYGGGDFVGKIIAFFTLPIIASVLSPTEFGILDLIMTLVGLGSVLVACGLNNATQRYYWESNITAAIRQKIVSTGFALQLLFGCALIIFAFISLAFVHPYFTSEITHLFSWVALVSAIFLTPITQWALYTQDVTRLHFKPWKFLTLSLMIRVLAAVLSLVAVVILHAGIDGYVFAQLLAVSIAVPVGLYLIRQDLTTGISREWAGRLLKFGYPFIFVTIAHWIFGSMDRWMLASMSSVEETGIYSISFRFASLLVFIITAFGMAWSPQAVKIKSDYPNEYKSIFGNVMLALLYIMLFFGGGLALFSGEIIGSIMPEDYALASVPLAILSFGVILQSTIQVTAVGISLSEKTSIFAHLAWITAGFNLIGNYLLIPSMGAGGAATATTLSYLLLTLSYVFFTQKLHPLTWPVMRILWLVFLGCIVAYVSLQFNHLAFEWPIILYKLAFALVCCFLGALALPLSSIRAFVRISR